MKDFRYLEDVLKSHLTPYLATVSRSYTGKTRLRGFKIY